MYCKEIKQRQMKQKVSRILQILKLIKFFKALVGGVMFIFSIHAVNAFLGCASFSWPHIPPTLDVMVWLKLCGLMGLLIVQGTVMASAISLVEEMLFRSWNHNFRAGIFFLAEIGALIRVYHCSTAGVQSVLVLCCFECAKDSSYAF